MRHTTCALVTGVRRVLFRSPFTRGTLTPNTPRLSSRDLFPGPNALTAQSAAGRNANVAGNRHALTPLGPGNKSRDDSGVVFSKAEPRVAIQFNQAFLRASAACAAARRANGDRKSVV